MTEQLGISEAPSLTIKGAAGEVGWLHAACMTAAGGPG